MTRGDWASRPVMVVGAGGMLGRDLVAVLQRGARGGTGGEVIALDRSALDVTCAAAVARAMDSFVPVTVINCAAYTQVDACELEIERTEAVNGRAPGILAAPCRRLGATLVHFSTDFVFDGRTNRPYRPDDATNPLSVYGRTKWEGEGAIRAAGCRHLIVRTSWLFGGWGGPFVEAMLAQAARGDELRVADDQVGRPTYTVDLSEAMVRLLGAGTSGPVHFANSGQCTRHEFAESIVRGAGLRVRVTAISSAELNRPANRPAYSVLDLSDYERVTGHTPRPWREALGEYLARRKSTDNAHT